MIFANSLPGFKTFLGKTASACADFSHVVASVACVLLPTVVRRSVQAASRSVCADLRDAGNLLRFLGGSRSPATLLAAAQQRLLHEARRQRDRLHIVVLDSTQIGQEGVHAENTYSCRNTNPRPRKSTRKQKKAAKRSCHCFVFALLLTPCGLRIPSWLPFYTQEYCERRGWRHQTQADLAARLLRELPLARSVPLVVVGDTAFEAKQVRQACRQRNAGRGCPAQPGAAAGGGEATRQGPVAGRIAVGVRLSSRGVPAGRGAAGPDGSRQREPASVEQARTRVLGPPTDGGSSCPSGGSRCCSRTNTTRTRPGR